MSASPRRNGDASRERSPRQRSRSDSRSRSGDRQDKRDKDPENFTQVYIAKLSRKTTESDLKSEFSKFGNIKNIVLKHAYAFIDFEDHESAERAIKEMNGKSFVNGEDLVVE
jgi:arginine/serine-rich splicing factor 7